MNERMPGYLAGRNGTRNVIRSGALVSEKKTGFIRRLLIRLGLSKVSTIEYTPYSPPLTELYIGMATEDIPSGGIGRIQISGPTPKSVVVIGRMI